MQTVAEPSNEFMERIKHRLKQLDSVSQSRNSNLNMQNSNIRNNPRTINEIASGNANEAYPESASFGPRKPNLQIDTQSGNQRMDQGRRNSKPIQNSRQSGNLPNNYEQMYSPADVESAPNGTMPFFRGPSTNPGPNRTHPNLFLSPDASSYEMAGPHGARQVEINALEKRYIIGEEELCSFRKLLEKQNTTLDIQIQSLEDTHRGAVRLSQKAVTQIEELVEQLDRTVTAFSAQTAEYLREGRKQIFDGMEKLYRSLRGEQLNDLTSELENESRQTQQKVHSDLLSLKGKLSEEIKARDQAQKEIMNSVGQSIDKVEQALSKERHQRNQQRSSMMQMIDQMVETIGDCVENDRIDIQQSISSLEETLEAVCVRIQTKLLGK